MPLYLFSLFQTFLLVIGIVGVMVAVTPWIAIPVIPLGIAFFFSSGISQRLHEMLNAWNVQVSTGLSGWFGRVGWFSFMAFH